MRCLIRAPLFVLKTEISEIKTNMSHYCIQGLTNQNLIYRTCPVQYFCYKILNFFGFPYISHTFFWASKKIFYLPSKTFYLSRTTGQWICQALCISTIIRCSFFLPKQSINLDPSYKNDLDHWDCLGRVILV